MKKTVLISLTVLVATSVVVYLVYFPCYYGGTDWEDRTIEQLDAEARLAYFASRLQLEGDDSVLPSSDYPALDSIIAVMKAFERDSFRYTITLRSHHPERSEGEEQAAAQAVAESFRQYFINAGVASELLTATGTAGKAHFYTDEDNPLDWSKPHRQLDIDVELPPKKQET